MWTDTDPDRTGLLRFVFEDGFGFETYARYALDVPMYFVKRGPRYIDVAGRSFRQFMFGELAELPGEKPSIKDWGDHLTTLFPEVRLKQYLEMRGADSGPMDPPERPAGAMGGRLLRQGRPWPRPGTCARAGRPSSASSCGWTRRAPG